MSRLRAGRTTVLKEFEHFARGIEIMPAVLAPLGCFLVRAPHRDLIIFVNMRRRPNG